MAMTIKARNEYAKMMTWYAKGHLARGLVQWKGDPDMIAMVRGDAKDYRTIGRLLREQGGAAAYKHAGSLDTAARDQIPTQVWDAMAIDDDAEAQTRQEWSDDIIRRSIAVLEGRRQAIDNEIARAKARIGTPG